jgi:hypothetical protein
MVIMQFAVGLMSLCKECGQSRGGFISSPVISGTHHWETHHQYNGLAGVVKRLEQLEL